MTADIRDQYAYLKPQPFVWLAVLGSALVHLGLVGLLVVGGILKEHHVPEKRQAILTKLVRKGKKKADDILPVKDRPKPPPPAPKPAAVNPKPDAAKPDAKPRPKSKPAAKPSKVDYSSDMASAFDKIKPTDYEDQGDPDGVEDGEALVKQKGDEYLTKVYKAVKKQYEVPELIPAKERMFLRADVILYIDRAGGIKELKLSKPSGNQLYDNAVVGAIRRAAPFPAPPTELADVYADDGIQIPFRASKM